MSITLTAITLTVTIEGRFIGLFLPPSLYFDLSNSHFHPTSHGELNDSPLESEPT